MGIIYIGWAEESIVPDKKVRLAGQFYERISEYVESEIAVTAMAVETDGEQMILVSADIAGVPLSVLELSREKFSKLTSEVDPRKIIVTATHTHNSLVLSTVTSTGKDNKNPIASAKEILCEFLPADKMYEAKVTVSPDIMTPEEGTEFVAEKIAIACKKAWDARAEAYYTNEFGRAAVGMCRRVSYDDGTAQMWGDANTANFVSLEGGNDSGIELIYTFDKNKKLTGVVANIACPSQILEQRSFISADFWGRAKAILRQKLGENIHLLALPGAAGDQCPRDLVRWVNPETPIDDPHVSRPNYIERKADPSMFDISGCNKVGKRIANEIISVYEEITNLKDEAVFEHKIIDLDLPLRKATIEEYNEAVRQIEHYVEKNKDKPIFDYEDNARMYVYAGTIQRFREQQFTEIFTIESHIIRFGNISISTSPFELFLDYGNRIKARSKSEQSFIVQLCCGKGGYLPTEKAQKAGHYSAYITSGTVGYEGGDLLVRETISQINKLWNKGYN